MSYVTLETNRVGYSPEQCRERTMTIQELIDCLSAYDPDEKIYLSNDNGYTYGIITQSAIEEVYENEEDYYGK